MHEALKEKIRRLKEEKKAVILAHNYQRPEVQDIADFVGDSLGLSQQAAGTPAEVVVFCGVHFMAETAAILNPDKTVLIPDPEAGCPMANMIDAAGLAGLKKKHPQAVVVGYVNTTAEVKALCDICCTSANAGKIVAGVEPDREIIFVPDKYLGAHAAAQTGRKLILWNGYCPTHVRILPEHVNEQKRAHPGAEVVAHPECRPEVVALADAALSTSGMCRYPGKSKAREFIIATELGVIHQLKKLYPDREFHPASAQAVCPNMKRNSLEKVLWALEDLKHRVEVPEDVRVKAKQAVDRMIAAGREE